MPRNGSGVYVAPSSSFNPATNGVNADPTDWNALLADVTTALTGSLSSDGQTTATARVPFAQGVSTLAGSASAAAVCATGDTNTGLYFPGADQVGLAAGGAAVITGTATTATLPLATTVSSTLTVNGAATLKGAVTLGDASGDAITVTGTATFSQAITATGGVTGATTGAHNGTVGATSPNTGAFTTLTASGNVTLGDAGTDTLTVNAATTFANRAVVFLTPAAGASGYASIRLPHGAAPTTNITNGDVWSTTAGLYVRINGATKTLAFTDSSITGSAASLTTARSITATGDAAWTVNFDGSANATAALTLATVNSNTGAFGSATAVPVITVNAKGLITAVSTAALGTAAAKNTGTSGNTVPLLDGANTWSAKQTTAASASGGAGLNVPHGAAPSAPANGDFWSTTAGFFGRVNGTTKTLAFTDSNITGSAASLTTARAISATGDATWSVNFDGSAAASAALTLATVNSNTGSFGSASAVPVITVNAKGLITAVTTAALGTAAQQNTGTSGNNVPLLDGANTWSAKQTTAASAAGGSGFNLPHGAAPTAPANGDFWSTTAGFFGRVNGSTKAFAFTDSNITGSAASLTTARAITATGDASWTVNFDGSAAASAALTLATVNSNTGSFGSATAVPVVTVNGKGLVTAVTTAALGTSAAKNTGTSGNTVPLLDGANTYSGASTFSALVTLSAGASMTPAATPSTTAVGYLGTPQNSKATNYTTVMSDAGKDIYYTATATHTIPANASVAYPIGTAYEISAASGATITINITTDTLRWIPSNSTGSRTLTGPGSAVIKKKTATEWWITGVGLS